LLTRFLNHERNKIERSYQNMKKNHFLLIRGQFVIPSFPSISAMIRPPFSSLLSLFYFFQKTKHARLKKKPYFYREKAPSTEK